MTTQTLNLEYATAEPSAARKVGFLLGCGIFLAPYFFAWFVLRKGYSTVSRVIAFGWLAALILLNIGASINRPASTPTRPAVAKAVAASPEVPAAKRFQDMTPTEKVNRWADKVAEGNGANCPTIAQHVRAAGLRYGHTDPRVGELLQRAKEYGCI